jgi:tetratricopeptide (TPR) repeat protein
MGVDRKAVIAHLERAAAIDPEFWHPQLRLLAFYRSAEDTAKSEALKKRLQDNQDKFGPADVILFQYYEANLAGRTLEAYRKTRELLALAPRDVTYIFGAANLALSFNRPREALQCVGDVEKIDWKMFGHWMQGTWVLGVAAVSHHLLGEYEDELKVAEFGVRMYPDMLNVRGDRVRALAALGRLEAVDRTITECLSIRSRTGSPSEVMLTAAQELRAHGHPDDARRIASQCADWCGTLTGEEGSAAGASLTRVECLWLAERWDEASRLADQIVEGRPKDLYAKGYQGVLAARAGDRSVAERVDRDLAAEDDVRRRGNYSYLRAGIAAQRGEREQAVELLRVALAHGFPVRDNLHVYLFLEPLHGYQPFEELLKPKD